MAYKCAVTTGNWSTAATWDNVSNTPTSHATTNITLNATKTTAAFTAPVVDATCAATGVALFISTVPSAACSITVTLQESGVDCVPACTATIDMATVYAAIGTPLNNWLYFRVGTPYVFAVAAAGAYQWKITYTGAATTTLMADAAGTAPAYWSTNVVAVPAAPGNTDLVLIPGQNATSVIKVSVDGSRLIGNLTSTAACTQMRPATASLFWDVQVGYGGELNFDNTASATLTCKGCIAVGAGGTYRMDDKAGGSYAAAFVAKVIFDPTTSGDCGIGIFDKSTVIMEGQQKSSTTLWRTTPAATWNALDQLNLQTADNVGWAVGDVILVGATGGYAQTEYMTISNVDAANQYDFSAALTYAHSTSAQLLNITRNVVIETDSSTLGCYIYNANTVDANVSIQWVRFNNVGANLANKYGISLASGATVGGSYNYCVLNNPQVSTNGYHTYPASTVAKTYTGLIYCNAPSAAGVNSAGFYLTAAKNKNFTNCYAADAYGYGFQLISASNNTFTTCYGIATDTSNTVSRGSFHLTTSPNNKFISCEAHLNRQGAVVLAGSTDITFSNCLLGTKGANGADIYCVSDYYNNNVVFENCTQVDVVAVTNSNNMVTGSEVRIHNYNTTIMKHYAYRATGVYQATGATLADTTVRTAGSYAVGMFPDSSTGGTGLKWTSYVVARAGKTVVVYGYFKRFHASNVTPQFDVKLYLPGETTTPTGTAIYTAAAGTADDADWTSWLVSKAYTGTVDGLAKVEIVVTGTLGKAIVDDWYNGTNPLTALDVWEGGRPATIIYPELGDPAAVWAEIIAVDKSAGQLLELVAAMCRLAENTGFPTGPCVVRNLANTADLATITFDADGNVTDVVIA